MINLDTHVLIHALRDEVRPRERSLLQDNPWSISAIVLWELAKLIQLGRISLDLSDPAVDTVLSGIHVWPIDLDVAHTSTRLDFRGDPADELIAATSIVNRDLVDAQWQMSNPDELIAATSIVNRVPLLTRDKRILKSKLVPFI